MNVCVCVLCGIPEIEAETELGECMVWGRDLGREGGPKSGPMDSEAT